MEDLGLNFVRLSISLLCNSKVLDSGAAPDEILLVTEVYHADGRLDQTVAPMSGEQLKSLPRTEVNHTLISYSNYRLSARSGYGI